MGQDVDVPQPHSIVSRPSAQQIAGAIVRAMRLRSRMDNRAGVTASARKTLERGRRVKPATRAEYVFALSKELVRRGFPRPLIENDSMKRSEMVELVAGAIGEYCASWDECQGYFEAYGLRDADPLLTFLPMLRLALQDLGVRIGLHALPPYSESAPAFLREAPATLVSGSAFIAFVRFLLRERNRRRADVHAAVGATSYESWEAGALPQNGNIEKLAAFLGRDRAERERLDLELRVVVALVELWRWLRGVGLPDSHRTELARSFVEWTVHHALAFVGGIDGGPEEKEAARLMGIVRGPRHPPVGWGVAGLGNCAADEGFAVDLGALPGTWYPAVRRWHGFLDETTGAEDIRVAAGSDLPVEWSDRDVVGWALVSFHLCVEPEHSVVAEADDTSRMLEARAERALRGGDPAAAEQILHVATRRFGSEPWLHIKLAEALEAQGKLREAEHEVLIAAGLDDSIQDAQLLLARIRLRDGRPAEALHALAAAEEVSPGTPSSRSSRATRCVSSSDPRTR